MEIEGGGVVRCGHAVMGCEILPTSHNRCHTYPETFSTHVLFLCTTRDYSSSVVILST